MASSRFCCVLRPPPALFSPAPQARTAARIARHITASRRLHCICLRPWVASISKSSISQTSEIPASASTHTPTDLPAFCRVRSATPHLDGRHPESAKKPPLLDNHTPSRPFFFSLFWSALIRPASVPPRSPESVAKSGLGLPPALRIYSYTTRAGPKSLFSLFQVHCLDLDYLDIEHVGFDVIASRSSGTIILKRTCSHELEALCRLTRFALLRHKPFIRPS